MALVKCVLLFILSFTLSKTSELYGRDSFQKLLQKTTDNFDLEYFSNNSNGHTKFANSTYRMIEEGRTIVHHAMKRFMVILPAVFFKLGIAFTLLVVITLAVVNNGFIGFLLLVVGVGNVLARMQGSRTPQSIPILARIVNPYSAHHHIWDRSESSNIREADSTKQLAYSGIPTYNADSYF